MPKLPPLEPKNPPTYDQTWFWDVQPTGQIRVFPYATHLQVAQTSSIGDCEQA